MIVLTVTRVGTASQRARVTPVPNFFIPTMADVEVIEVQGTEPSIQGEVENTSTDGVIPTELESATNTLPGRFIF